MVSSEVCCVLSWNVNVLKGLMDCGSCSLIVCQMVRGRPAGVLDGCGPWWCCVFFVGTIGGECLTDRETFARDVLCRLQDFLWWFSAFGRAAPIPCCNAAAQQALDWNDAGVHAKLLQPPQEAKLLASFSDHSVCVWRVKGPGEVLCDLKLLTHSTQASLMWMHQRLPPHPPLPPVVDYHLLSFTDIERLFSWDRWFSTFTSPHHWLSSAKLELCLVNEEYKRL